MQFYEKLFKLRKEKGWSQEVLAEKLNTTRQAVSKWENGQGFPETEKLLMIGNIFEVSIDYLLKDTEMENSKEEKGYYVSREMAEGYLVHEARIAKYVAGGIGMLVLSTLPYLMIKDSPTRWILLTVVIATIGIGTISIGGFLEEDRYRVLKKEILIFDQQYLKELKGRCSHSRKKYTALGMVSICTLVMGGIPFLIDKKGFIDSGVIVDYYPICVFFIAVGVYLLVYTASVWEGHELLIKNEEYTNRIGFKIVKRLKRKIDEL